MLDSHFVNADSLKYSLFSVNIERDVEVEQRQCGRSLEQDGIVFPYALAIGLEHVLCFIADSTGFRKARDLARKTLPLLVAQG